MEGRGWEQLPPILRQRNSIKSADISANIGEVFGISRHKYSSRNTGRSNCSEWHWVAVINCEVFSSPTQIIEVPQTIAEA